MILKALYTMYRKVKKGLFSYLLMAFAFLAVAFLKIDAIWVILACAAIGLTVSLLTERREKKQ